ncbi:hypothetical protein KM043_007650 [Ampulex compressa]|nr:hypothetical protein KM043_007650 [Ampulex compressa]
MLQPWTVQGLMAQQHYGKQTRIFRRRRQAPDGRRWGKYVCSNVDCGRAFFWKGSLTWHMRYSCGQQPRFQCPYCTYKCKVKGDVRKHVMRMHKDNMVDVVDLFKERLQSTR